MQIHLKDGKSTWKQEWAEIGGKRCFFRSRWEYRYALYLELSLVGKKNGLKSKDTWMPKVKPR